MRTFIHRKTGHTYKVVQYVKMKHPQTRKWVQAVLYMSALDAEGGLFVRELTDFRERFEILNENK